MSDPFALSGPSYGPIAGGKPRSLVILLHGLGADGNDLIGLAPHWAPLLQHSMFVSPHAPFPCDMAPYGRQWFSLQERTAPMVLAGVKASGPILDDFIDAEMAKHGLSDDKLALVGFSQGTMMSLYVGPRRQRPVAGIVGYSGALVAGDVLAAEIKSRPPVLLVHGDADPIVPFQSMATAAAALRAAGIEVTTEGRPGLPHSIDEVGLALGGRFLARRLGQ